MLAVKTYSQSYIDTCRSRIEVQLAAYDKLLAAAGSDPSVPAVVDAFEAPFLHNLILVLDASFAHRTRAVEGKDGNPINEVRMLAASILQHDGVLAADKTIRYQPGTSVLGHAVGDEIRVDRDGFGRLSDAYFAEIERRFAEEASTTSQ